MKVPILLASLLAASALAAEPPEVKLSAPGNPDPLGSSFVPWESLTAKPTGAGVVRYVFDNPTAALLKLEVHITTLLPGKASHPPHRHPWEEMLFVREGSIEVYQNGRLTTAGPESLVFYASRDPHNATNNGTGPATYYAINFVSDRVPDMPAASAAERAVPGMLASGVFACDRAPGVRTPTGMRYDIVDSPTLTYRRLSVHETVLSEGQRTAADMVDEGNELFIVRKGVLETRVNGVRSLLREGALFYCAPNDRRSLRNAGTGDAAYLVIKVVTDRTPARSS